MPETMHFSGKLYFYFVAVIPILQHKSVTVRKLQARKEKEAVFLDVLTEVKNVQTRVTRGISFLPEEGRLSPDTGSPDTAWRRSPEAGHASLQCQGPGVRLLRSVSVRGRNVTFAVGFFFL